MNLQAFAITSKAICAFLGPSLLSLNVGLSQWSNEDIGPSVIQWIMILSGSVGAGVLGYGSFTSSAFGKFVAEKTGIDIANEKTETKP